MILSLIVLFIILYGVIKKIDIFDKFTEGAKESFSFIFTLFPCLLGMILCINIITTSGFFNYIFGFLKFISFPIELVLLGIMRPISSSSSLAILNSIYGLYGPDSFIGMWSSILQASTDTTIYILTLYFGSVGIKKIRYALWAGLLTDLGAFFISFLVIQAFI